MQTDDEAPVTKQEDSNDTSLDNVSVRLDKSDPVKKEKKSDTEDPKPRIVLTFRSEKSGAKTSNMKIVSNEEKHEEISPRRSIRTRNTKKESDDDISHLDSEDDESIETTPKRSTRRHSKEFTDVIANAIARKEKSYNVASLAPTQRLSRRIKPTAKILANEELRMGLESQNNARLGISADKSEEGVRTRRSAQARNSEFASEKKTSKRKLQEESANESSDKESDHSSKKLIHLTNLGLKVKDEESSEAENRKTESSANEAADDDDDEEMDDDLEVISKLLEADEESASDEDFCPETSTKKSRSRRNCSPAPLRRSSRKANSGLYYYDQFAFDDADCDYKPKRKSTRSHGVDHTEDVQSEGETEAKVASDAAGAEESAEAACPADTSTIVATCLCEEPSNVYAAPSELKEPVFCQAVELVEGVRVGCSHALPPHADHQLLRAGLRAPFILVCRLHAAQMRRHMCCPLCGLFCTQGIFNQCSKGHLFHPECGIQGGEAKQRGCPHCGVHSYRWTPVNRDHSRVRVDMHCSNKRVFLPDQREQCTPAFLGFSNVDPSQLDQDPAIPEELLSLIPSDLKKLFERDNEEDLSEHSIQALYEAIIAGDPVDQLVPKMIRGDNVNSPLIELEGGTCAHAAALRARVDALCVLQYAGADLDAVDNGARTPLMRAILALLDKEPAEEAEQEVHEDEAHDSTEIKQEVPELEVEIKQEEVDIKPDIKEDGDNNDDPNKPSDEDLIKVIKYLVAVGCDVNKQGPEGMTPLHMAAQYGSEIVCKVLLQSGDVTVNARDQGGWTALVRAAENKHPHIVRLLLEHGADAMATDNEGNLAVHWCALAGDARSLALLLRAAPAAANAPNAHTDTPLHVAAREGHYACVIVLLAHGAKTDQENSAGELPVEVCSGPCHNAISLNMQMTMAVKDKMPRSRILSSDISKGREPFPVPCVNEVDDAVLPDDFTYVSQHVAPEHVPVDDCIDTMQGCRCAECGAECACCVLGVRRWYRAGRLPAAFPHHDPPMLFECNQTCACDAKRCPNRVVGLMERAGSLGVPVEVYRTARCGWGLRVRRRTLRGTLVALYRGELLPHDRADSRADDQYMFALDLKPDLLEQCTDQTQLCVDAARYGSAARFMNHSCRPSVAPVRVFTDIRDLRLPHVALFALRDLQPGDALTFDYGDKFWSVKSKWMKCECEEPDCRYPTKSTEEIDS